MSDMDATILNLFRQLTNEQKEKFIFLVQAISLEQQAKSFSDQELTSSLDS